MTTRSATPPDTASRVWIALHEFVTGWERKGDLHSALSVFDRTLRSPANRIRQT
jgi:hypothetical protein